MDKTLNDFYPETEKSKSQFPLLILCDGKHYICRGALDVPSGMRFKVLETNFHVTIRDGANRIKWEI